MQFLPAWRYNNNERKLSNKASASSEDAIAHGGEKVPIIGHLICFSVKESRIEPEEVRKLFAKIGYGIHMEKCTKAI